MIVEFIGSTGAGKTTLFSEVQRSLARTTEVVTSFDLVAAPLGLRGVTHPTVRNLIQELAGFPFFVRSLPRHRAFIFCALRMLARQARFAQTNFTLFTINNLRSLVRKIGVYEITRRCEQNRIILVDEGTVLSAHNVFVYTSAAYAAEEIAHFATLIPLPDIIVYVRAPVDRLVERSLRRKDPPRELRAKSRVQIETYINRAVTMFEQLVKAEEIGSRVLTVENPEITGKGRDEAVDRITKFVLRNTSSGNQALDPRSLSVEEKQYVD